MLKITFSVFFAISVVLGFPTKPMVDYDRAEELGGYFEGDIELSPEQRSSIENFNGLKSVTTKWTNKIVPYIISEEFDDEQHKYVRRGLDTLELATCLKFVERTTEPNFVNVVPTESGCSSSVGQRGGEQFLRLAPNATETGCFRLATIMHEFIHAIGFYHMQSTYDRDDYVVVVRDKIRPGTENNFNKYDDSVVSDFGISYDYNSVMHYGPTGFSIDGSPTLIPKDPLATIGQRVGLSRKDIEKINRMYECPLN